MKLTILVLMLVLAGCATAPPRYVDTFKGPMQYPAQPQRNVNIGGGVDTQGNASGWFSTMLRIGQCILMPTVNGGTYSDKATGNVQISCNP